MDSFIRTSGLYKSYLPFSDFSPLILNLQRQPVVALKDVNLRIGVGELVALIGLNGAGKSTLLKVLSGNLLPSEGQILVNKEPATQLYLKQNTILVYNSERSFYGKISVRENLLFFGSLWGIDKITLNNRINYLCDIFKINDLERNFQYYSSGYKEIFCIIRALLTDKQVLLIDELTQFLDYKAKEIFVDFIKNELVQRQNKTVIVATNILVDLKIYDKIILLHKGEIKVQGAPQKICSQRETSLAESLKQIIND